MNRLYFIRHGESQGNERRIFTGRLDLPLNELGRAQAKLAAEQAKTLAIDRIISSPLVRARQTAEIIASNIDYPKQNIILSELLMERDYGDLHGKTYAAADGLDYETVPNIETTPQLVQRATRAIEFLKQQPGNILVVAHGTIGRVLRQSLLDQTDAVEVPIEQEIPNAVIVQWI